MSYKKGKTPMKIVLGCIRRANNEFGLIENGDKIAVGVSGGKDSMLLLYGLFLYKRYMKLDCELHAITVDLGFPEYDTAPIAEFAAKLGIPYYVKRTHISDVVFGERGGKNPCAMCSMLRKGAFYDEVGRIGCNKAALGHHADDLVETLVLSLFYESRINTFAPKSYLTRSGVTLIRPFIFLPESEVVREANRQNIPVCKNPCPADGVTKRQEIKQLLDSMKNVNPGIRKNILAAIQNTHTYNLWDKL